MKQTSSPPNFKMKGLSLFSVLVMSLLITACPTKNIREIEPTNKIPTDILLTNLAIKEALPVKTIISPITAKHPDEDETITLELLKGADKFIIESDTLKSKAIFDFETEKFFDITIKATDKVGNKLERGFRITVTEDKLKTALKQEQKARAQAISNFNLDLKNKELPYSNKRKAIPAEQLGKTVEVKTTNPQQDPVDKNYDCKTITYKASAEYNQNVILNPSTDVFFPGAILKGESIDDATYIPLGVGNRTDVTISTSLPGVEGRIARTVAPILSKVRQAQIDILKQEIKGSTPAQISFEIRQIASSAEVLSTIGAGFDKDPATATQISSAIEFDGKKSVYMIKYIQVYYTMDVDPKSRASDFFQDARKFKGVNIGKMPVYVSSVKYGRMAFFTVQSTAKADKLKEAIDATFKKGNEDGSFKLNKEYENILNSATIKATILGGSGAQAALAVEGISGIKKYLKEGGNYSQNSPGAPIAYTFRSILDNSEVKAILSSEYSVKKCEIVRDVVEQAKVAFGELIKTKKVPYTDTRNRIPSAERNLTKKLVESPTAAPTDFSCKNVKYKASAEYSENIILNSSTDVFFPGSIIKGESIENGKYIQLAVGNRSPVTISTSLRGIGGSVAKTVEPTLSATRQAVADILKQKSAGATPAQISFTIEEIFSKNQVNLAIGAGYNQDGGASKAAEITGSFDFTKTNVKSRFLIKFVQTYYTIDVNSKARAADFFQDVSKLDAADLGQMPMYISSIVYGRIAYFGFESSTESAKMSSALKAVFRTANSKGDLTATTEQENIIKSSSIEATILGGSASSAVGAISGIEGIKKYIREGANYSKDSPGVPIGFVFRSVHNGAIMSAILSTEYTVKQCTRTHSNYKVTVIDIRDAKGGDGLFDDDYELYGSIILRPNHPTDAGYHYVWSYSSDDYKSIDIGTSDKIIIDDSRNYKFTVDQINSGKEFSIHVWLTDWDKSSANDPLGSATKVFKIKEITLGQLYRVAIQQSGRGATVTYRVESLD